MGITVAARVQYENAVKKLFPRGAYWDEQFADPASDASIFIKAKADELIRFRGRMGSLYNESRPETADELIEDWERVLLGGSNIGKTLAERRLLLKSKEDDYLNRAVLEKTAGMFGLNIQDVTVPYRPRCFGFARFAQERIGSFLTFFVVRVAVAESGIETDHWQTIKEEFEEAVRNKLLANQIAVFNYGGTLI